MADLGLAEAARPALGAPVASPTFPLQYICRKPRSVSGVRPLGSLRLSRTLDRREAWSHSVAGNFDSPVRDCSTSVGGTM